MNDDLISTIITRIGTLLFELTDSSDGNSMIYAEVEPGVYSVSVFVDRGEAVHYVRDPVAIEKAILELWAAAEQDKKWSAVCYRLIGDEFKVTFDYGENWDDEELGLDRRQRVIEEFYPDRKITYPKIGLDAPPGGLST